MTESRDPDRLIHGFLREGENLLDDRVYDAVRAAIEHQRQRGVMAPWRTPLMKFVTYGLGAAALVVILLVGARLLGSSSSNVGSGGDATPMPTPEITATDQPSAAEPTPSDAGFLREGPFLVQDAEALPDTPRITVTIPGPGWTALPEFGGLNHLPDTDPPTAMLLWAWPAGTTFQVFEDPCHWATNGRIDAHSVDELAAALASQPLRDASEPEDVRIGAHDGKHLTLHVPDDWSPTSNDCDQQNFASYAVDGGDPSRYHQGANQIDELWILDVDGQIAIIDVMYRPDTAAEVIDEMRSMAASVTFGP